METAAAIPTMIEKRPPHVALRLLLAGRVILGAIFVFSAYTKFHFNGTWHFRDYWFFFSMVVDSYHILPGGGQAVQLMGHFLPWFELVLGVLLIFGIALHWVAVASSALLAVFIGSMWRAYALGLSINCGCFGNGEKLGVASLLRDTAFLVFSLAVSIGAFLIKKQDSAVSS